MNEFHRRLGDGDFHVVEEINLGDKDIANHSGFHENTPTQKISPETKSLLQNIESNSEYYCIESSQINAESVENGDIVEVQFIKERAQKDTPIRLRFFIRMKYSTSILGFIYIKDLSNGFDSKVRTEKINLPIVQGGKRKIILSESLSEAIFIATNPYIHETRIKDMKIYRKGTKSESMKSFIKSKINGLFSKKS